MYRHCVVGLAGFVLIAANLAWGAGAGDVPASEARRHVGEELTVAMTVRHAKDSPHEDCFFLDSEADYKAPDNLAVVIPHADADAFKKAGIADIVKHFDGKAIRVKGTVIREKDQTRIRVTTPGRIQLDPAKDASPLK